MPRPLTPGLAGNEQAPVRTRQPESSEVLALRDAVRRAEALVAQFRAEMGDGFYLTIQHAAHLDGLRMELNAAMHPEGETEAQRQSRLDSEADEAMDAAERYFLGGGVSTPSSQLQKPVEIDDEDDPAMLIRLAQMDSLYG